MRLHSERGGPGPLPVAALFALFFAYVWLRIEPHLIYHVQEPVFFRGAAFFQHLWVLPGGLTEYVAAWLGQAYAFGWPGALLLTGAVAGITVCTDAYVQASAGRHWSPAIFAPAALLMVLHNRYQYELAFDLSLLLVLAAAAAYAARADSPARRGVAFLLAAPLYWVTGGTFLLFVLLAAVRDTMVRKPVPAIVWLAMGGALPWLATWTVYPGMIADAYLRLLPLSGQYLAGNRRVVVAAIVLYLFPAVAAVLARRLPAADSGEASRVPRLVANLAMGILAAVAIYGTHDANHKRMLEIDYRSQHRDWGGVLEAARQLTAYDVRTVYDVQRALAHEGRIGNDLLGFPHLVSAPVFVPSPETPTRFLVIADNLLDMGYVNKAEHMLQEALEIHGERPSILRRLVTVNILKDRPGAARVYLGLLRKSPLDRSWAEAYLAALDTDPQRDDDARIRDLRQMRVTEDYPGFFTAEDILRQVLDAHPHNALAFELLMANYLQMAQVDRLVFQMHRVDDFPERYAGPWLPRLYEEAYLFYASQVARKTGRVPPLPGRGKRLSEETQRRFRDFSQAVAGAGADREAARRAVAQQFGDTYWYYYLFRGAERGVPLVTRASYPMP